ncbi:methyltransferase domain-containing protein [Christiangramia portivictoriae]|uniref:methyltransferase domain-containing protein n=1 Tax=Christiangramia portivictoriae TaxID=326069 RepID=UPI0004216859|nr:methyltransferase domain-containing protein [Christiangramia portivictoriae]
MNKSYWNNRYRNNQTGWDLGAVSPPIKAFADGIEDKELNILIPGAGNAYEAEYLFKNGFKNVFLCDIAEIPLKSFLDRNPEFPELQTLHCDYFELQGSFDLVLEQTFFCALPVNQRSAYAQKTSELLRSGGVLAGLLFDFELKEDGPPYGGSREEYLTYFSPYFHIEILERAYNSIKPRSGNELFFKFRKK